MQELPDTAMCIMKIASENKTLGFKENVFLEEIAFCCLVSDAQNVRTAQPLEIQLV